MLILSLNLWDNNILSTHTHTHSPHDANSVQLTQHKCQAQLGANRYNLHAGKIEEARPAKDNASPEGMHADLSGEYNMVFTLDKVKSRGAGMMFGPRFTE